MMVKNANNIELYTYNISWSKEDALHVGSCIEFPSLSWLDETQEGALAGIKKIISDVIEDMEKNNESIPEPFAERHYSGKLSLRIPPEVHRKLAICAAAQKISINRLINSKL